jgi:3-polyprenyl-4-hydroxybenzoate decarboxylase
MARYLIGMTGASGSIHAVDFIRRCPGEKYLVLSDWARQVLHSETGLTPADLEPHVKRIFADTDLAAPFSSMPTSSCPARSPRSPRSPSASPTRSSPAPPRSRSRSACA